MIVSPEPLERNSQRKADEEKRSGGLGNAPEAKMNTGYDMEITRTAEHLFNQLTFGSWDQGGEGYLS